MPQAMSEISVNVPGKGSKLQQSWHPRFIFLFIYEKDFMKKPSDSKNVFFIFCTNSIPAFIQVLPSGTNTCIKKKKLNISNHRRISSPLEKLQIKMSAIEYICGVSSSCC